MITKQHQNQSYEHEHIYEEFGISQAAWLNLARIAHHVEKDGIKAACILPLSKKPKEGIEIIFQKGNKGYVLSLSAKTGDLYLTFYRNLDRSKAETVIKGSIERWKEMGEKMLCLR